MFLIQFQKQSWMDSTTSIMKMEDFSVEMKACRLIGQCIEHSGTPHAPP